MKGLRPEMMKIEGGVFLGVRVTMFGLNQEER